MGGLDTRQGRASAVSLLRPYGLAAPGSDGKIDVKDRAHLALVYGGLFVEGVASSPRRSAGGTFGGPVRLRRPRRPAPSRVRFRAGFGAEAGVRVEVILVEVRRAVIEESFGVSVRMVEGVMRRLEVEGTGAMVRIKPSMLVHEEELAEEREARREEEESHLLGLI